jgi:tetratricopeptide (TPR) repeat protein
MIISLDVDSFSLTMKKNLHFEIEPFEDKCACISYLLSTRNKTIFFAVSATAGKIVVPLIHSHAYVRSIYIYQNSDGSDISWMVDYPKIIGVWPSVYEMTEKLIQAMQSYTARPTQWSRSHEMFAELWTQSCSKLPRITKLFTKEKMTVDRNISNIITLLCSKCHAFHLSHGMIKLNEFTDIEQCAEFIKINHKGSTIFLIICVDFVNHKGIQALLELDPIHATYIWTDDNAHDELRMTSIYDNKKFGGVFNDSNDILLHIANDICFCREIPSHIPKISIFKADILSIDQLNEKIDFIYFQLLIDVLQQISLTIDSHSELWTRINIDQSNSLFRNLLNSTQLGQMIHELFSQHDLSDLLESSLPFIYIDQRLAALATKIDSRPTVIYRANIISKEYLDLIENNVHNMLTVQTIMLFSRSFSSVTDICRRAIDNGLNVVLFEIDVLEKTTLSQVDSDIFAFRLGSVFRILSVDQMPDGIQHVRLELIDRAMQHIKKQLEIEADDNYNRWLTFGNYLTAIKQYEEAKMYYDYVLHNSKIDRSICSSIYHNMNLMRLAMNRESEALHFFQKMLIKLLGVSIETEESDSYILKQQPITHAEFDEATLYRKIAEEYYRQEDYTKAFDYYEKSLELVSDSNSNRFFQTKIKKL